MTPRLRPARPRDARAMGRILHAFQARHDWMPRLYSRAECRRYAATMIRRGWVTVALRFGRVAGFIARDGAEICALYLAPRAAGRGMARLLMDEAKARTDRLWLRCVETNHHARRFYARHGFVETARGADEDTELPDITYVWTAEAA